MKVYCLLATILCFSPLSAQDTQFSPALTRAQTHLKAQEKGSHSRPTAVINQPLRPEAYRQKAEELTKRMVGARLEAIRKMANSTHSNNEKNIHGYVLSTYIRDFSDINPNIQAQLAMIKEDIQILIRLVATDIELNGSENTGTLTLDESGRVVYTPSDKLAPQLNAKKEKLLRADLSNSVSIHSATIAIKLLSAINRDFIDQAAVAETPEELRRLYMVQASFVYEMTDIVIDLLERLSLTGEKPIYELYEEAKARISKETQEIDQQIARVQQLAEQGKMPTESVAHALQTNQSFKLSDARVLDEWGKLITRVKKQADYLKKIKEEKEVLLYNRKQAELQLATIRNIVEISELNMAFVSLDDLVDGVKELELLPLNEKTVQRLLGYSGEL